MTPPQDTKLEEPAYDVELGDELDDALAAEEELEVGRIQGLLGDRRRLVSIAVLIVLLLVAIYVLLPKVAGLSDVFDRLGEATWYWIVAAIGFNALSFIAYATLFRGILGGTRDDPVRRRLDLTASYQITMASFAATLLFSAGGAGGLAMTYWALRKAGMPRRRSACRMVAFLVLQYAVYLGGVLVFAVLLRTQVLPGSAPLAGTIIPAALAATVIGLFLLVALIPEDVERRLSGFSERQHRLRHLARVAKGPATVASGVRTAISYVRHPSRGAVGLVGATGYWAANICVLWACFKAFGVSPSFGVLVLGFFVGMAANLIPSFAGGVGSVDAGLIGSFVLFDLHANDVFPAVLLFRAIFFWLPIIPGVIAYFQLRSTVAGWEPLPEERPAEGYTSQSKVRAAEAR